MARRLFYLENMFKIHNKFSLQQMYDKKLAKKLDEFEPQKISISDSDFSPLVSSL